MVRAKGGNLLGNLKPFKLNITFFIYFSCRLDTESLYTITIQQIANTYGGKNFT